MANAFFFFHFVRREGDGRGGQAEQPDRLVFKRTGGVGWGGVRVHRIAPTHTPIKSIGIVKDGKKTGNHCKK